MNSSDLTSISGAFFRAFSQFFEIYENKKFFELYYNPAGSFFSNKTGYGIPYPAQKTGSRNLRTLHETDWIFDGSKKKCNTIKIEH